MLDIDFNFIWTGVNLLILYLLMRKFLFKRVGDFMDARAAGIAADIEAGRRSREEGDAYRIGYEGMMGDARSESKAIVEESRVRADREYDQRILEARAQAQAVLDKARDEIDRERQDAYDEVKGSVATLALLAASKVIEANMDTDQNRALVDSFLSGQEAA